ncbi:MAG TPA: EamA family transporter [Armatimonadota bacterium]
MTERAKIVAAWSALGFIWGSTYLALRVGVLTFPPFLMAGVRFLIAGVALLFIARARGAQFPRGRSAYAALCLTALLLMVGGNGGTTWASQKAPSSLVGLLGSTSPLMIGFLSLFLPGSERLKPVGWAGLALGLVGLGVLLRPSGGAPIGPAALGCGIAVVCWSAGSLLSRHRAPKCDAMASNAIQMLIGAVVLCAMGLITEHGLKQPLNWPALAAVAYLTVVGSCVGFTLFFWLLARVPAAKVATYAYVNPVVAVILGWAVLHERITGATLLGAAVTLAGVILTNAGRAAAPALISAPIPEPAAPE